MHDLIVIGAGPAGYIGAIKAAQEGMDVVVFDENKRPGGVCLNWGCIPTKSLLHLAEKFQFTKNAADYGISLEVDGVDWEQVVSKSRRVVRRLGKGIEALFKKYGVRLKKKRASLVEPGVVEADGERFEAENLLLATGSKPLELDSVSANGERIMTSREALSLDRLPDSLLIAGGGAIGLEFAYLFNTFGVDVTVLELEDQLLPGADREVARVVEKELSKAGINFETSTAVAGLSQQQDEVVAETESGSGYSAELGLIALGRVPAVDGCPGEKVEPETDSRGWIEVDRSYQTSLPGVYAAGDAIGPPHLAHVASAEALRAVDSMLGAQPDPLDYDRIPAAVFTNPEVGAMGLTETEAKQSYDRVETGKFPFRALGRAVAEAEVEGFVKLVFAGEDSELVGAHAAGADVASLLGELSLAGSLGATPEELHRAVHVHPTRSEAIPEAALTAVGNPLHM